MVDHSRPVNPRMHYVALTMTSSSCLKLYLNPREMGLDLFGNLFSPHGIHSLIKCEMGEDV